MTLTKPRRYTTSADVQRRLSNTFVRYKGKPVFVYDVQDLNCVLFTPLAPAFKPEAATLSAIVVDSSDVDLDIESPALGWANMIQKDRTVPVYFMRTISRQFQQGVHPGRCWFVAPYMSGGEEIKTGWRISNWNDYMPFVKMLADVDYPSIDASVRYGAGAAFDKQWAVVPSGDKKSDIWQVYHESNSVGLYDISKKVFYFARHSLTKTRRVSLESILAKAENRGSYYAVEEQN